jgi:hypothetical protein
MNMSGIVGTVVLDGPLVIYIGDYISAARTVREDGPYMKQ